MVRRGVAGDLELSIAVGFGLSHVATLAAAGHRFFVVGGPEVQLATDRSPSVISSPWGRLGYSACFWC